MPDSPHNETVVARKIRAHGLALGCGTAEIAVEIHEQCGRVFGTSRIKSYRLALGVGLSHVVAQIRAIYEVEGKPAPKLGETLLSAYESGSKRPGSVYLHYLCKVYRAEPDDLGYHGPCVCGGEHNDGPGAHSAAVPLTKPTFPGPPGRPTSRQPGGRFGYGPADSDALVGSVVVPMPDDRTWKNPNDLRSQRRAADSTPTETGEEDIVLRRTLLQLLAGTGIAGTTANTLDSQFLGAVNDLRRKMDDTLASSTVSPAMLDQWEETVLGYGRQYQATPSLRMLCDVLLDFSEVRRMCDRRQPVELQERLYRIAAQLSTLSGLVIINLGDHRLARSFFRTARSAADESGDRALGAWVTARESLLPMYYGDPREALHLARKAQDLAGRTPCVAGAMAPAVEARALGMLALRGRTDVAPSARRALARGRAVHDQLTKAQSDDLVFGFTERQMAFYEGDTYTNLGDHQRGEESFSHALTLYTGADLIDRTLVRFGRAHCKLQAGHPDAAAAAGEEAVRDLSREFQADILMHRARQLGAAITAKHGEVPGMTGFREVLAVPPIQSPTVAQPAGKPA